MAMSGAFEQVLRRVRRRCDANVWLAHAALIIAAAGLALAVAVAAERLLAAQLISAWSIGGLAVAIAAGTVAAWLLRRPSVMNVALLIDQRLALQERFSTTLLLAGDPARLDDFVQAAAEQTRGVATSLAVGPGSARLGRMFPVRLTRRWQWAAAAWLAVAAVVLLMPHYDLLGAAARRDADRRQAEQLAKAKTDVQQVAGQVQSLISKLDDANLTAEAAALSKAATENRSEADVRREAIHKLGDISERLRQMQGEKPALAAENLRDMLKHLRGLPDGQTRELGKSLAAGDLGKAAQAARRLQERLRDEKITPQEKAALKRELATLGRRLEEQAEKKQSLRDALEQAGQNPDLAGESDLNKLQEALAKAGVTGEKLAELMNKAAACKGASDAAKDLASKLGKCAGQDGSEGLTPDEMADLVRELSDLDADQLKLAEIEAGLDEVAQAIALLGEGEGEGDQPGGKCGGGQSPWREGLALEQSQGTGGPGKGEEPRETGKDDGARVTAKTGVPNTDTGAAKPIIASWFFRGEQVKGQSAKDVQDAVRASRDRAADAITDNRIPHKYESSVKKYFDQIQQPDQPPENKPAGTP
jgi:uncharacterized protein YlxW (UPF0749 family)